MKKLLALTLALVMLFSLTACQLFAPSDDNCTTGHVDDDGDEKCDRCGADVPKDPDDDQKDSDAYLAPTISEAIAAQLESASSMKIDFSVSFDYSYDGYEEEYTGNPDDAVTDFDDWVIEEYKDQDKMDLDASIVLSKTESGFNMMITMTVAKLVEDEDGNSKTEEMTQTLYVIDGSAYAYDEDLGAYVENMIPSLDGLMSGANTPAAITEMISSMLAQLEIPKEEQDALLAEVGTIITGIFEIVDKKGDLNIDFKPYLDELFTYVKELDLSVKTLESFIDDVLHLVDEELCIADILDKAKSLASLTVGEAMTELDTWLTENYETTIQGVYDTIVADERIEQLVRTYMGMLGVPEGEEPIDEEDIQAFLDELKAIKVDEFIAAYVSPDVVLYDFIMSLVSSMGGEEAPEPEFNPNSPEGTMPLSDELGGEDEPSYPPINTLFGVIEDYLDNTLQYVDNDINYFFYNLKEALAGIKINTLSTSSNIAFTETFALSELSFGAKIDIETEYPYGFDNSKTEYTAFKLDYAFTISNISDSTVEISLPENSKVIFGIFNIEEIFSSEDGMYELELYWPYEDEDGKFVVEGELYVPDMYIDISMEMPTEKQDVYTFDYTFMPNDSNTPITGKLFITFDYEAMSYSVEFEKK